MCSVCMHRKRAGSSDNTSEQKNFDRYRENILVTLFSVCRSSYFKHENGTAISDDLMAVCRCDRDQSQLNAIKTELNQERDAINKIVTRKCSASCTSVEQLYDTCHVFGSIRAISKNSNSHASGLRQLLGEKLKDKGHEETLSKVAEIKCFIILRLVLL